MNRTYIIAEIGTSHGGDLEKAYQLGQTLIREVLDNN
jgi:sialic acid synthase SpsE